MPNRLSLRLDISTKKSSFHTVYWWGTHSAKRCCVEPLLPPSDHLKKSHDIYVETRETWHPTVTWTEVYTDVFQKSCDTSRRPTCAVAHHLRQLQHTIFLLADTLEEIWVIRWTQLVEMVQVVSYLSLHWSHPKARPQPGIHGTSDKHINLPNHDRYNSQQPLFQVVAQQVASSFEEIRKETFCLGNLWNENKVYDISRYWLVNDEFQWISGIPSKLRVARKHGVQAHCWALALAHVTISVWKQEGSKIYLLYQL